MNDTEPLNDEDFRAAMLEFVIISDLRKQVEASHMEIARLHNLLREKQATEFSQVAFGFDPKTDPVIPGRCSEGRLAPTPSLDRFRKVNTEVMTASTFVTHEIIHHEKAWKDGMERETMRNSLGVLFAGMEKRGLFKHSVKKGEHEDIYIVGIEVATP